MSDPAPSRSPAAGAWLLAGVLGTAVNLRAAVTSVGALLPEIQAALSMTAFQAGLLTSLPVVAFGVIALTANAVARRLGVTRALVVATVAIAVGLVLRVAVPTVTWLLATSLVVLAAIAVGNVLLPVVVRTWFPLRVGPVTGWYAIAISVATALPAALAVPVAAALGGWRPGLAIWAVPASLALVPWIVITRRGHVPQPPAPATDEGPTGATVHRRLQAWALAVYFGIQALEAYVAMGWLPSILRDAGVPAGQAGTLLGVTMLVGGPVALLVPRLAGRSEDQRVYVLGLAALSLVGYLGLLLAPATLPLLWAVLLGLGLGAFPLALLLLGVRAATPEGTAALSSLAQGVGYLIAATGPVTIGLLRDASGGWTLPLLVLLGLLVPKVLAGLIAGAPGHVDVVGSGPGLGSRGRRVTADPGSPPTP